MPQGAFRVFQDPTNPRDIKFEIISADPIASDQNSLRNAVDHALTVLRSIFPADDKRFDRYFYPLLSLAQAGLVGSTAQPEVALHALSSLKNDITANEGGRIKNQYMKALGLRALLLGLPPLVLGLILRWMDSELPRAIYFLFLWSGCMAGVWLSFGARKTFFKFDDLHLPEQDQLEPLIRLSFAGLLTMILGLSFSTQAITVALGAVDTSQFVSSIELALLLGMLCGFSEQALSSQIAKHASVLIDTSKGR